MIHSHTTTARCAAVLVAVVLMMSPSMGSCFQCRVHDQASTAADAETCCVAVSTCTCCATDQEPGGSPGSPLAGDCGGRCGCCQDLPQDRSPDIQEVPRPTLTVVSDSPARPRVTFAHRVHPHASDSGPGDSSRRASLCVWLI